MQRCTSSSDRPARPVATDGRIDAFAPAAVRVVCPPLEMHKYASFSQIWLNWSNMRARFCLAICVLNRSYILFTRQLWAVLIDGIAIAHVSPVSGESFPSERLRARAQSRGSFTLNRVVFDR